MPDDPIARAFLSYAHQDDEHEDGRIRRLADLLAAEFELLTGSRIEIFTDRSGIQWGDDWREQIEEALQQTTFFIPVLSPTYFVRDECRAEMTRFTTAANDLGLRKLLLSIRYIAVPDMREDSVDDLKAKAAAMQYEPWEALRLTAENSPEHRQAINRMAARLVQLTQELEVQGEVPDVSIGSAALVAPASPTPSSSFLGPTSPLTQSPTDTSPHDDDTDEDGPLDILADAEPAMADWSETLTQIPIVTARFNEKFSAATEEMNVANSQPNSFARKVQIARALAQNVEAELGEIEGLSKDYSDRLGRVDRVFHAMYEMASLSTNESTADEVATLNGTVRTLIEASLRARDGLKSAADAARTNAKISKDLRPVLRRFETAVRNIMDGTAVIESWGALGGA